MPHLLGAVRIAIGLLFFQHGAQKLWGFAGGPIDHNFATLHGFAGPLEVTGGLLIFLGLFTRLCAFILCGEMAVAYFVRWAPHGPLPITNGGELAVIFCFIYLWLVTAGSGTWSLDYLMRRDTLIQKRTAGRTIASWEVYARSVLRVILAFTFSLHGYRGLLGLFPAAAGRPGAVPMALDRLPALAGGLEIFGGLLLFAGLFTRLTAAALCVELLAAYLYSAAPRGIWPIGNGGEETLLYLLVFLCFAATGGGAWSVDYITGKTRRNPASTVPAL